MKRFIMSIVLIVLLTFSVYTQEPKKEKQVKTENSSETLVVSGTIMATVGDVLSFQGGGNSWVNFRETKKDYDRHCHCGLECDHISFTAIGSSGNAAIWTGIELTEDGWVITGDEDYTYIEKPNTDISSYYDKKSKILRVSSGKDVYIYKWEDQLGGFVFLGMETGR